MNRHALQQRDCTTPAPAPLRTVRAGLAVRRFRKDLARVGVYTHPHDQWTLRITPQRLRAWAAAFHRMRRDGVDVPVNVDHSPRAEDVRGYVVDMFVEQDRLIAVHEMHGSDAIVLAERVRNVSPYIELDYTAGNGVRYGEAITHSAIVQQPVIPGQEPFAAVCSLSPGERVRAELPHNSNRINNHLSGRLIMNLEPIRTLLGVGDELTADNAATFIADRLRETITQRNESAAAAESLTGEVQQLRARVRELENKSAGKTQPDSDTLAMLAEGAEAAIEQLVGAGNITPAVAAGIRRVYVGEPGHHNAFALSAAYAGRPVSPIRELLDILRQNRPIDFQPRTGVQALSLTREDDDEHKERQAEREAAARLLKLGAGVP